MYIKVLAIVASVLFSVAAMPGFASGASGPSGVSGASGPTATATQSKKPTGAYLYVLGVAQDAGYPQAGCYQPHCMPGWQDPLLRRGATSIALVDPAAKASICSRRHLIYRHSSTILRCRHRLQKLPWRGSF